MTHEAISTLWGVLLFELLTDTTPLEKERIKTAGYAEIQRMICEEEAPRPSTRLSSFSGTEAAPETPKGTNSKRLSQFVRGDLDWIVMKALEKDRARRYQLASGFAADLERYLHDKPVEACPPSAAYQLRKYAKRNKTGLAVGVLVLFFVVAMGSVVGWSVRDREVRKQESAQKAERDLALIEQAVLQSVDQASKIRGELHAELAKKGGRAETPQSARSLVLFD